MPEIKENIALAPLTTFKIGGAARYFVEATTEDEMRQAINWAHEHEIKFVIIAGGSNVLVPDEGLNKLVIHIVSKQFSFAGNELAADAGCNLLDLIKTAGERGLGGWESLAGIPGSIGGAVRGNAGAFGSEIKDFVHKVKAINMNTGETAHYVNAECAFAYRTSFFKLHPKWLITRAYIELKRISPAASGEKAADTIAEREKRHLQNVQAAGSYFTNPVTLDSVRTEFEIEKLTKSREGRVPAGWLIEKAGMKGEGVGGAISSPQHADYIVNTGNATAQDVLDLSHKIKDAVHKKFKVDLVEEAAILA